MCPTVRPGIGRPLGYSSKTAAMIRLPEAPSGSRRRGRSSANASSARTSTIAMMRKSCLMRALVILLDASLRLSAPRLPLRRGRGVPILRCPLITTASATELVERSCTAVNRVLGAARSQRARDGRSKAFWNRHQASRETILLPSPNDRRRRA